MGYEQSMHPGRKWSRYSNLLRAMRTSQEKRFWDDEFGRLKRSPHRLPEYRDDYIRSDWKHHSWKRHRQHQWKPRPPE